MDSYFGYLVVEKEKLMATYAEAADVVVADINLVENLAVIVVDYNVVAVVLSIVVVVVAVVVEIVDKKAVIEIEEVVDVDY